MVRCGGSSMLIHEAARKLSACVWNVYFGIHFNRIRELFVTLERAASTASTIHVKVKVWKTTCFPSSECSLFLILFFFFLILHWKQYPPIPKHLYIFTSSLKTESFFRSECDGTGGFQKNWSRNFNVVESGRRILYVFRAKLHLELFLCRWIILLFVRFRMMVVNGGPLQPFL